MPQVVYNRLELKRFRKKLRKDSTDAERLIWWHLRNKQVYGMKFYRQFSVGRYIVDFYCPSLKLAIELDGGQHSEDGQKLKDELRTRYLESLQIKVIRFWDNDCFTNLSGVLETIYSEVEVRKGGTGTVTKK